MTNKSSSMTMKSDNESKLVNTTNNNSSINVNNNNIYYNCSNKSTVPATPSSSAAANSSGSDLPSITLAPFSKIKRETDISCRPSSMVVTKSISGNNSQVPTPATATPQQSPVNQNSSVSAKMGSRRIFTPQFKLQVLESYRNDSDCKGNQRATARKYNIHRRQIQKWLQCESNLRSSVANISANNVKHQFHNITHQMPIVTTSTLPSTSASSSIHTNNSNHHQHHHHHHHAHAHHNQQYKAINNRLSLDTTRHSVAATSIAIPPTSTKPPTQGVLAAAANVEVGAVAPLSSPSPSSTAFLSTTVKSLHAPTSSSLSPVIGGPAGGAQLHAAAYHHHHHHQQQQQHLDGMGIHTPPALLTSVPVSVPIITPHPHTHLHVANLKSHYHHLHMEQQQHHHHHLHHPYNQVAQLQAPASERRPFMPSASLPALPNSSSSSSSPSLSSSSPSVAAASSPPAPMTAVALSCTDTAATTPAVALSLGRAEENRIDVELRDYQTTAENRYMNENEYVHSRTQLHRAFEGFHYYMPLHMHPAAAAAAAMIAPIDLSLGTKRLHDALQSDDGKRGAFIVSPKREPIPKEDGQHHHNEDDDGDDDDNDDSQLNVVDSDFSESPTVVDLTLRKRKVLMPTATTDPETVSAEKHTKLSATDGDQHPDEKDNDKPHHEPAKTFKLFKPYLLGDDNADKDPDTTKICRQKDPIIWSHHTACLSPPISQCSSRGSNFQSPPVDAYPFPAGSPSFQPTPTVPATSAGFRCPKGSPVSGYESSSSIYSDSASSNGGDHHPYGSAPQHTTYSFDLKVHNINGDLPEKHLISTATAGGCIPLPPNANINHVQRWLDQEPGIRQSIALYV